MKLILHKVLEDPFVHPEYMDENGSEVYCVLYLAECNGEVEETEMLYDTLDEAYKEANLVKKTIEGVVITNNDMYDA